MNRRLTAPNWVYGLAILMALAAVALAISRLGSDSAATAATPTAAPAAAETLLVGTNGRALTRTANADGSQCLAYDETTACSEPGKRLLDGRSVFSYFTGHHENGHLVVDTVLGVAAPGVASVQWIDTAGNTSDVPTSKSGAFMITGKALAPGTVRGIDGAGKTVATDG